MFMLLKCVSAKGLSLGSGLCGGPQPVTKVLGYYWLLEVIEILWEIFFLSNILHWSSQLGISVRDPIMLHVSCTNWSGGNENIL